MHFDSVDNFKQLVENYQPLILIVDNDRDNLFFASCIIEAMGMRYIVIDDSEECLKTVHKLLPDIILLDVVMPKVSGIEIAEIIKHDSKVSHISIIAVTGLTRDQDKIKLIEAGFDDYICKPYLIEELESKVYDNLKCCLI